MTLNTSNIKENRMKFDCSSVYLLIQFHRNSTLFKDELLCNIHYFCLCMSWWQGDRSYLCPYKSFRIILLKKRLLRPQLTHTKREKQWTVIFLLSFVSVTRNRLQPMRFWLHKDRIGVLRLHLFLFFYSTKTKVGLRIFIYATAQKD